MSSTVYGIHNALQLEGVTGCGGSEVHLTGSSERQRWRSAQSAVVELLIATMTK